MFCVALMILRREVTQVHCDACSGGEHVNTFSHFLDLKIFSCHVMPDRWSFQYCTEVVAGQKRWDYGRSNTLCLLSFRVVTAALAFCLWMKKTRKKTKPVLIRTSSKVKHVSPSLDNIIMLVSCNWCVLLSTTNTVQDFDVSLKPSFIYLFVCVCYRLTVDDQVDAVAVCICNWVSVFVRVC